MTQTTSTQSQNTTGQTGSGQSLQESLIDFITTIIFPLGYEVVHLEIQTHRQKTVRLFIDFAEERAAAIGVEDCVRVTRALDEPLDQFAELDRAFAGGYELEVSSPGVDRPLRQAKDYERFKGREVRIHTFRPLTPEELGDADYQAKNPKQKNFLGTLKGLQDNNVQLALPKGGKPEKNGQKKKQNGNGPALLAEIRIPLALISKANIEPNFDFDAKESRDL